MKLKCLSLIMDFLLIFFCSSSYLSARQSVGNQQAIPMLQSAYAALMGHSNVSDVTLTGTVRRIVGSDDETGTATLKALASGAGRVDLSLPSGQRIEVENMAAPTPAGAWAGPDGISHAMPYHNLLAEPAWFFPAFAIAHRLSTGYVATYVGQETREGHTLHHISVSQLSSLRAPPGLASFEHLTQVEFFLDSTTFLPTAITFNLHPDGNMGIDIPVEIRFSSYQAVSGAQVPFHVEKFLNNSLILDFQAQTVTANTGLTISMFNTF